MTKGHLHVKVEMPEIYWGIQGSGLLFMDENRKTTIEIVEPGLLHYIRGNIAHRLINVGDDLLAVGACWSTEAGHDYATIEKQGFSKRIFKQNGKWVAKEVG